jgi:hypothetical protein
MATTTPVSNIIPVPNVTQLTDIYCGAASAKAVLDYLGPNDLTQGQLYCENHEFPTKDKRIKPPWSSSPDGLVNTLNINKPADFTGKFALYTEGRESAYAMRMVWTIYHYNIPCIALVHTENHWVVVNGYESDEISLTGPTDRSFKILGLYICDPLLPNTQCNIDYESWKLNYAKYPVDKGIWYGKFISICDPRPIKLKMGKGTSITLQQQTSQKSPAKTFMTKINSISGNSMVHVANSNINMRLNQAPSIVLISNPVNGEKIIDKNTARKYSLWWLQDRGFYNLKMLNLILFKPIPGNPVLIEYLGTIDFYYMVPLKESNRKIYTVMSIAANNANYQETAFSKDINEPIAFAPLTHAKIINMIKSKYGPQSLKKMSIHPALVWKPCSESRTPYLPFHMVTIGKRKVYIRIDQKMFTKLTTGVSGF